MKHTPRKRFGQNFLQDYQIIDAILRVIRPQKKDNMLEIGPGLGALTQPLLRQLTKLIAVEIDADLFQYLTQLPEGQNKLQLMLADALTINYSQFGSNLRIVGNLPYNISTPLLIYLLQFLPFIKDMHFMLQKEVAHRIAAEPGSKAYGRLSVMLQYHCEVTSLFNVFPESFDPQPKVVSTVIRLVPFSAPPFEIVAIEQLERLVAKAFAMRRKTLANNLKGLLSLAQLTELGVDGCKRPEQISVAEYAQIAKFISN